MAGSDSLVKKIAEQLHLPQTTANDLLAAFSSTLGRQLLEGQKIELPGFGQFELRQQAARRAPDLRNPGKTVAVSARAVPAFLPAASLKSTVKTIKIHHKPLALGDVARPTKVAFVNLSTLTIPKAVLELLPERILRRYQILPIALLGETLQLAMVDPENHEAIELVKKTTGKTIVPLLTTQADLTKILDRSGSGTSEISELAHEAEETIEAVPEEKRSEATNEAGLEHAPAAKLVSNLLKRAVREGASDIHIEPSEEITIIRFRVDGVLREIARVPIGIHSGMVARIKVLTNLRLDERRLPQDGRFRALIDHGEIDFRVSSLPTVDGEKIVMRILDKSAGILTLDQLGIRGKNFTILEEEIHKPHGMILVTGPTGSGKTTTLYAAIDRLRSTTTNITTLEDPVEYRLPGVNQSQVHAEIGFSFAAGLRSILRQDPNVVLVGEIRDKETAEIAVNAALTGHIVLSTLHTNDAAGAIPRLIDMGVEPFLISSSLNAIVAQRLVRKICEKCRVSIGFTETVSEIKTEVHRVQSNRAVMDQLTDLKDKLKKPMFFAGKGCTACGNTGYKGRFGIHEILAMSDTLKQLIAHRANATAISELAMKNGMLSMRQDGLLKALDGLTTIEEVWRVTKV